MTTAIIAPGKTKAVAIWSTLSTLWLSVIVVASRSQTATGQPAAAPFRPRTQLKWLLNTGNFAGHWPPANVSQFGCQNQNGNNTTTANTSCSVSCGSTGTASPNTITRLQMIRGGSTAVLVMPTGDGSNRCCIDGIIPQFSLGFVDLKHGVNNLFPIIQPFPDWRAFVNIASDKPTGVPTNKPTGTPIDQPTGTPTNQPTGTPKDHPTETPTNQPNGTTTNQPTGIPSDQPTGTPTDDPTEKPMNQTTGTPSENPSGKPMDKVIETTAGDPTKTSSNEPTKMTPDVTTQMTPNISTKMLPEKPTVMAPDETPKITSGEPTKTAPNDPTKTTPDVRNKTTPNDPCNFMAMTNESVTTPLSHNIPQVNVTTEQLKTVPGAHHDHQPIINAVDAFLDERGRLLWVLDTGVAGENACYGNMPSSSRRRSSNESDTDDLLPPKFIAIDVHENEIVSVVSLSRVWRPGLSCFQYIVAVYPDETDVEASGYTNYTTKGPGDGTTNSNTTGPDDGATNSTTSGRCITWPLVVVGDAGTNRLLVYSHDIDKFTEIMLPSEGESTMHMDGDGGGGPGRNQFKNPPKRRQSKPPVRDILYLVPLYPRPGQTRLFITYYGCWDVYNLRLQPSEAEQNVPLSSSAGDGPATPPPPAAVTGTLTIMGRKPCRMVLLGSDRRRTDIGDQPNFSGGGNTVFFRLENTNDVWSWDTGRKSSAAGDGRLIDQRLFRLVRPGRTCRVPVSVSAAPVAATAKNIGAQESASGPQQQQQQQQQQQVIRQVVWMLETNFVDHFAGTTDGMGVNAKLQPLEVPAHDGRGLDDDDGLSTTSGPNKKRRLLPLRVQPSKEHKRNATAASVRPDNTSRTTLSDRSSTTHL